MSTGDEPTEEELRAAYEAELKKIRIEQILLEQIVSLVNLGMRRTGLAPGTEDERDPAQVRTAIEAVRALLPLVEQSAPAQVNAIRDALSQLQLAYVRIGGPAEAGTPVASAGGQAPPSGGPAGERGPASGPGAPPPGPGAPPPGPGASPPGPGAPPPGPGAPPPGPGASPPGPGAPPPGQGPEPKPGEPGPAQRSGRLWIPGQ